MKRVLFVSYYFPPSGGPGVQRVLKFVKYLPEAGWTPQVLTVRPGDAAYPDWDASLEADVPEDVTIHRTRAWDPYTWYARLQGKSRQEAIGVGFTGEGKAGRTQRLARWIRANVFIPDARRGWIPFALRRARRLWREDAFDVMVTSGPPHSTHLVGLALAREGVPWLADFRDPWTDISYNRLLPFTPRARRKDRAYEQRVLDTADHVVTVSPALGDRLAEKTSTPVTVIPNGFDPDDFRAVRPVRADRFVLAHTGTLAPDQNPGGLWQALGSLVKAHPAFPLEIHLVGNVDPVVAAGWEAAGLGDRVRRTPYVSHPEAIAFMQEAALLLLCINRVPGAEAIVTGKIYEYLASGRPVLGIGPAGGDAARILAETGAGRMVDHDDVAGMAALLESARAAWAAGTPHTGADPGAAGAYDRRRQAARLGALLDALNPAR